MSKYFWSIDEGHGGLDGESRYTTPAHKGKQYTFEDGFAIYEGVVNRQIGEFLKEMLDEAEIEYDSINDPILDTRLSDRVKRIDDNFYRERKQHGRVAILVSIHSNAMTKPENIDGVGQSVASNFTLWTSKGQTKSDILVPYFEDNYNKVEDWRVAKDRSDGDADFEADFYILRKSDGPAILVENLFFDNRKCADYLMSAYGQKKIAKAIFNSIMDCEESEPI
jgi:N-acetylmuramoyl-L-alanine amidase